MASRRIAIVGAGISGLSAASFLAASGNSVTLFERFPKPMARGAGLLMQPTGLAVLAALGLDREIIDGGSVITRLHGRVAHSRFTTLDVAYKDFSPHAFGVGVHRGTLFTVLFRKAREAGVTIVSGCEIVATEDADDSIRLVAATGDAYGPFDLVIDASGQRSTLRGRNGVTRRAKAYPYGALWGTVTLDESWIATATLEQRYKGAFHMIGILPIGRDPETGRLQAAFFWSLRVKDHAGWLAQPFAGWQGYVARLWPEIESLVTQFRSHGDLTLATYHDVVLRDFHRKRLVFIGDSAHCTSPQLGQGANLGLLDAFVLSRSLTEHQNIHDALRAYAAGRRGHLRFYQMASRWLTPFFQSDSRLLARLRFVTCGAACRIPFTRRLAAHVLTGTKLGLFSSMNPGTISPGYDLFKTSSKALIE